MAEGDKDDAAKAALSRSLTEDAERAVRLLQKLLAPQGEGKKPAMAKTSLAAAKGVAFTFTSRMSLGFGITSGHGFVVSRQHTPEGWSAPLYFNIHKVSLGISYGMGNVSSCLLLNTLAEVESFKQSQPIFGTDARLMLSTEEVTSKGPEDSAAPYSVVEGTMLDISVAGGALALDTQRLKELYGVNGTAGDVLEGKVSVPGDFAPLYKLLRDADGSSANQT